MAGEFDGEYKYVPHGFVHVWEKAGWEVIPHILRGSHHGIYAECMKWKGEGPAICPPIEAAA